MFFPRRWGACGVAIAATITAGLALPSASATNTDGGGTGAVFVPITPCRLFDTRADSVVGPRSTPLTAAETYTQAVAGTNGDCSIPTQATGVAMNVTAVDPTATSYLTIWPADSSRPLASNLNWIVGAPPTPNKVDVKLSADGRLSLYNNGGTVDVVADVVGYYAGHNHDDRYYTKAQIDTAVHIHHDSYPPGSLQLLGGGTLAFSGGGGCLGSGNTSGSGTIALVMPIGAHSISVDVMSLDAPGASPYEAFLVKHTLAADDSVVDELGHAQHGTLTSSTTVHDILTAAPTETIDPGESLEITFNGLQNSLNGFCGATVTYQTTG